MRRKAKKETAKKTTTSKAKKTERVSMPLRTMAQVNRVMASTMRLQTKVQKWKGEPAVIAAKHLNKAAKALESCSIVLSEGEGDIITKVRAALSVGQQVQFKDDNRYLAFSTLDKKALIILDVIQYLNDKGRMVVEYKVGLADKASEMIMLVAKTQVKALPANQYVDGAGVAWNVEQDEDDEDDELDTSFNVDEFEDEGEEENANEETSEASEDSESEEAAEASDEEEEEDFNFDDEDEEEEQVHKLSEVPRGVRRLRARRG
jgi:hypothetical protein|tara:strand:- start:10934 stop:11719 length:786 start_codon:yes stop_codon:yes gene_type:complete